MSDVMFMGDFGQRSRQSIQEQAWSLIREFVSTIDHIGWEINYYDKSIRFKQRRAYGDQIKISLSGCVDYEAHRAGRLRCSKFELREIRPAIAKARELMM